MKLGHPQTTNSTTITCCFDGVAFSGGSGSLEEGSSSLNVARVGARVGVLIV